MPGPTLCGELTNWEPDELLLNCCADDPNEPPEGDDFEFRRREENDTPRWFDTRKDLSAEADAVGDDESGEDGDEPLVADTGDDLFVSDQELVVINDAAKEGVVDDVDYPDYTKSMVPADDSGDLIPAESRARVAVSRGVRYRRSALRIT
jgi:hypothetical protein